jgi:hypothetical protein
VPSTSSTDKIELSWRSFVVNGNTIYQATNRNVLRDVLFHQHKVELRTPALLFRTYGSWESSGRAYDSRFTGILLNQWAKSNPDWFLAYFEGIACTVPMKRPVCMLIRLLP